MRKFCHIFVTNQIQSYESFNVAKKLLFLREGAKVNAVIFRNKFETQISFSLRHCRSQRLQNGLWTPTFLVEFLHFNDSGDYFSFCRGRKKVQTCSTLPSPFSGRVNGVKTSLLSLSHKPQFAWRHRAPEFGKTAAAS